MYDFQNTVLLTARPERSTITVRYLTLLLAAAGLLGCIWVNPLIFALPSVLADRIMVVDMVSYQYRI